MSSNFAQNWLTSNQQDDLAPLFANGAAFRSPVAPSRTGGGSGSPGFISPQQALAATPPPAADPAYTGQQQAQAQALDDGTNQPVAASRYLAYKSDPEWQKNDATQNAAMSSASGFIPIILDKFTNGAYSANKANQYSMAAANKREIERRYYNDASMAESAREHFPVAPSQPNVYDPATGTYSNRYIGDRGSIRSTPEPRPIKEMTNEKGEIVSATPGPGGRDWVALGGGRTDGGAPSTDIAGDTPEAGGVAESYPPMQVIRDAGTLRANKQADALAAETLAHADYYGADAKKALAEAGNKRYIDIGAGNSPLDTQTGTYGKQAPQTAAMLRDPLARDAKMSLENIERAAREYADSLGRSSKLDEFSKEAKDMWRKAYDSTKSALLAYNGYAPTPAAAASTQKFAPGSVTKVSIADLSK